MPNAVLKDKDLPNILKFKFGSLDGFAGMHLRWEACLVQFKATSRPSHGNKGRAASKILVGLFASTHGHLSTLVCNVLIQL